MQSIVHFDLAVRNLNSSLIALISRFSLLVKSVILTPVCLVTIIQIISYEYLFRPAYLFRCSPSKSYYQKMLVGFSLEMPRCIELGVSSVYNRVSFWHWITWIQPPDAGLRLPQKSNLTAPPVRRYNSAGDRRPNVDGKFVLFPTSTSSPSFSHFYTSQASSCYSSLAVCG